MHREEPGTWTRIIPHGSFLLQITVLENKSSSRKEKKDNLPETQERPAIGEDSILVKRQAFHFFITF